MARDLSLLLHCEEMSAAAVLGIICESAASCIMITMALRLMNVSECHEDVTR